MQLGLSFSTLLASVLIAFSATESVEARPFSRMNAGMLTMPLKRIPQNPNIHPQVLLQQHLNKAHKRLAKMKGREPTPDHVFRERLNKRLYLLPDQKHAKRYNRIGVPTQEDIAEKFKGAPVNTDVVDSSASDSTTGGISPLDVQAEQAGTVSDALPPTDSDSLGLDIESNDVGYLATVQMGTPPTDYLLLMDSGSADLWVGSADNCVSQAGGNCGNHTFLGSQTSSSFVGSTQQFSVTYGSGSIDGTLCQDTVSIANLTLTNHTFGVANEESVQFSSDSTPFDGLMGLAQPTLSEEQVDTPPVSLANANLIAAPIVSFKLARLADQNNDGEVTFGGLDSTKFVANTLTTLPVVSTAGFWEVNADAFSVNGQSANLNGRTAILDTGTSLIVAPPADAAAIHALIPGAQQDGQGGFTVPCTTNASVAITFGGTNFAIDPRDITFSPVNPNDLQGDCVSGISAGEIDGETTWLVGDVFLKNAYFSTNVATNQVQLAQLTTN
jgi:hypothetical protein